MRGLTILVVSCLFLWGVVGVCHPSCEDCNRPDVPTVDYTCTKCHPEQFLYMSWCYKCQYCHQMGQCAQCALNHPNEQSSINQNDLIAIIASSIVGGIVIVVAVICLCRRCKAESTIEQRKSLPSDSRLVVLNPQAFQWQPSHKKISQGENCAICLDGGVFLETLCRHFYHARCLQQWALKAGDCPLCKSKIISPTKFYCQNCFQSFVEVEIREVGSVINGQHWNKCHACRDYV